MKMSREGLPSLLTALTRVWWAIGGSNPGPTGYEPVALTNWANGPYRGIPKHGYYTTFRFICQVLKEIFILICRHHLLFLLIATRTCFSPIFFTNRKGLALQGLFYWRRRWDSNPRAILLATRFRVETVMTTSIHLRRCGMIAFEIEAELSNACYYTTKAKKKQALFKKKFAKNKKVFLAAPMGRSVWNTKYFSKRFTVFFWK